MRYRVAIATSDNRQVDMHFGKAFRFMIVDISPFDDDDGTAGLAMENPFEPGAEVNVHFVENRDVIPVSEQGKRDEKQLFTNAQLLSDCQYLVAARVGWNARYELNAQGIVVFEHAGSIGETLEALEENRRKTQILATLLNTVGSDQ